MIESHAFAMAVFEISAALKDCVGAGPQADIRVMMNKETMVRYFFFIFFSVYLFLPQTFAVSTNALATVI